ncbi:MAG: hypothetical protein H7Y27_08120 [Gemmatimonadaceae bacterium]|nr:hypothetical protein [Chitinophagaceae bacterium]
MKARTYTSYSVTDQKTKAYCQISLMLSTAGKGNITDDFSSEWSELVAKQYGVVDTPATTVPGTSNGWEMKSGMAAFAFNNGKSVAMLTTYSGYDKVVSIIALTNSDSYIPAIQSFLQSVELKVPAPTKTPTGNTINLPSGKSNFAFTTTNFDDGWVSNAKDDWAEVTKGNITVLIHYPNKAADDYNPNLLDGLKNAWDVLVAPRYSSASGMQFRPLSGWQPIEYAEADMIEKATGKNVHVVFFKKLFSNGSGRYLEFVAPDRTAFETAFGAYGESAIAPVWDKMAAMAGYNRFAVAAADLQGKWTNNFSGMTQYVNAVTGASAGADTHASNENFAFGAGNTYNWDLGVASGFVGSIKFQSVKSAGTFTMLNNWQIRFSDMEGKPKTYNVQFTCIKGARVLWIGETAFGKKID